MLHCFEDESNVYLVMEHFEGLELYQLIKKYKARKERMEELLVAKIFA
jgi:serine/threonine protein kinase